MQAPALSVSHVTHAYGARVALEAMSGLERREAFDVGEADVVATLGLVPAKPVLGEHERDRAGVQGFRVDEDAVHVEDDGIDDGHARPAVRPAVVPG